MWVQLPLPHSLLFYRRREFKQKEGFVIKYITKDGIKKLLSKGIIKNTHRGYVSKNGSEVGYYMTSGKKRYIQDKYADIAEKL